MGRFGRFMFGAGAAGVVALEAIALAGWQGWHLPKVAVAPVPAVTPALRQAEGPVVSMADDEQADAGPASAPDTPGRAEAPAVLALAPAMPALLAQPMAKLTAPLAADERYYRQLRARLRWVQTRIGDAALLTPDTRSRMLLAKSAAQRARLHEVGLGFQDVYGLISAETSWIPRPGASRDGTPNLGAAQFEPATARALGVRDPDDVVEAVHAAASHMKDAAVWSAARIAHLRLADGERAQKLREGVSIYYNLSVRGRNVWNGRNTHKLPRETRQHIRNSRLGALQAADLEDALAASGAAPMPSDHVVTAELAR